MENEIRVTMHNGRRSRKDGAAYCPKHNSRSAGIGAHVDKGRIHKNIYLTFNVDGTITQYTGDEKVDFDAHEARVYTELFSESLEAQNNVEIFIGTTLVRMRVVFRMVLDRHW